MSISVTTKINLNIRGQNIELDLIEAKELYSYLSRIFDKKEVPTIHPFIDPWIKDYTYPDIKWHTYTKGSGASNCMHKNCPSCKGSGVKSDGGLCIHSMSCPCPSCTPTYSTSYTNVA